MSRNLVFKFISLIIFCLIFALLWSLVYELVVAARYKPTLTAEGTSRWALLRLQMADHSYLTYLNAWKHFYPRLLYPATQMETIIRGAIAAAVVIGLFAAGFIASIFLKKPMPYGEAHFGSLREAEQKRLTSKKGLLLGKLGRRILSSNDPAHVLVVGPTRSGKGVSFVIPNGFSWVGSSVWFDPKRENYAAIAPYRKKIGDKVFMFAPGQTETHRYNPLDFVRRDERMGTDSLIIASFLIPETGAEIWGRSARLLLSAMVGYVIALPRYETRRTLRSVTELTSTGQDFNRVLKQIVKAEATELPRWIIDGLNQFIALEPETRNSALFNVSIALNPWNNDLVAAATETTDFDIRNFRREKTALFIGCSIAELDIFRPIIKLLVQQIHDELMSSIPSKDEPYQVLMMIDEFRQLGRMDDLVSKLTINAGYGFRMVLILQDLGQLDELYGKSIRITTVSACQVKLFIRINDLETSEYVSEMLGDTTQEIRTPIMRAGQNIFSARDKNLHYTARPLRSPQELRGMSERLAIVIIPNAPAFEVSKLLYYKQQPFKRYAAAAKSVALAVPRLVITKPVAKAVEHIVESESNGRGPVQLQAAIEAPDITIPLPSGMSHAPVTVDEQTTTVAANEISSSSFAPVTHKPLAVKFKKIIVQPTRNDVMSIDEILSLSRPGLSGEASVLVAETQSKVETKDSAEALFQLLNTAKTFADE